MTPHAKLWFALIKSLSIVILCGAHCARAEMWKCVDADGTTRYTNVKADARGCKSLNLEPERPAAAPAARAPAKTGNFPSVDGITQRQRDAERRRLLEMELGDEQREPHGQLREEVMKSDREREVKSMKG